MRPLLLLALVGCTKKAPTAATDCPPADLIVIGHPGEEGEPTATLIDGATIRQQVHPAKAACYAAAHTTTLEAEVVTAGFVDAHGHPGWVAQLLHQVDLTGLPTYAAVLERLAAHSADGPIRGHGWDQTDWPDAPAGGWPLAADLTRLLPGRTVSLSRIDGHASWVSADLLATAQDVEGGEVIRDASGAATGVLIDASMDTVADVPYPAVTEARAIEAMEGLVDLGLTGVHAMSVSDAELEVYARLALQRRLPMRLWVYVSADSQAATRLLSEGPWRVGERLAVVGIKQFIDGAMGSRGAWLHAPYADAPDHKGLPQTSTEDLTALATAALRARVQLAVHAIGDAGVDATLDAFIAARRAVPEAASTPLRIEHVQVLSPGALARFEEAGAIASMQPTHATSDMPWAEARLGPERVRRAYAWKDVLDAGIPLAFGSDFPVESAAPSNGLWAATRRQDPAGNPSGGWLVEQAIESTDAVAAFTSGTYTAVGEIGGTLDAGARADLTLWSIQDGRWLPKGTIIDGVLSP